MILLATPSTHCLSKCFDVLAKLREHAPEFATARGHSLLWTLMPSVATGEHILPPPDGLVHCPEHFKTQFNVSFSPVDQARLHKQRRKRKAAGSGGGGDSEHSDKSSSENPSRAASPNPTVDLEGKPLNSDVRLEVALWRLGIGQVDEGLDMIEEIIKQKRSKTFVPYHNAQLNVWRDQAGKEANAMNGLYHFRRSIFFARLGYVDEAFMELALAIQSNPQPDYLWKRAMYFRSFDNLEAAVVDMTAAIGCAGRMMGSAVDAAMIHTERAATAMSQQSLNLCELYFDRAIIYERMSRVAEAAQAAGRPSMSVYGSSTSRNMAINSAIGDFQEILRLDPHNEGALNHRCRLYIRGNMLAEATADLEQLVRMQGVEAQNRDDTLMLANLFMLQVRTIPSSLSLSLSLFALN
jgi:tetratricopeptide (TPR) repeat protein